MLLIYLIHMDKEANQDSTDTNGWRVMEYSSKLTPKLEQFSEN